jgi:hypothetical protein
VKFEYDLDRWIESRVEDEHQRKQHRLELRTGFIPLTNAIQAAHTDPKHYHFSNECDLINRLVTGMPAKKFKQVRGIESVRDGLTAAELRMMDKLQMQNTSLIELGFSYEERKSIFNKQTVFALAEPVRGLYQPPAQNQMLPMTGTKKPEL